MNFWQGLLNSIISSAAQGAAAAGNSGADLKTTGVAAGAAATAGLLGFILKSILAHPLGQHPAVPAAIAAVKPPA